MAKSDEIKTSFLKAQQILSKLEGRPFLEVLEILAAAFGSEAAIYWIIDSDRRLLREARSWYTPGLLLDALRVDTATRTFVMGEGMPGQAWKYKRPYLSNDLQMDMSLPRSTEAYKAGFRRGFWIPVLTDQDITGVIELLGGTMLLNGGDA